MKTTSPTRRIVDRVLTAAILACFSLGAWFWTNSPHSNAAVSKDRGITQGAHHAQRDLTSPANAESRDANSAIRPATRYITKNIEDIREGDFVLAREEYGSTLGYRKVVEVYRRTSYHLRHLTFESEDGTQQTIETTDEHPFWLATQDRWRNAGDLTVGDHVIAPDGRFQILTITHRTEHPLGVPVFNFQVEKSHTYFVASASDDQPLLVHNSNCLPGLDATGKVHGALPHPKDLGKYDPDDLRRLKDELKQSVGERINKTVELGSDVGHGQRQGAEQALIKSIEKFLSGS